MLGEEVNDASANRLVGQLLMLSADDPESDICLFINSPGGSVVAGLAVYDTMQLIPNDVATVAIGFAASMGQVLLCGGAEGKRFALPHAQVVMHEGSAGLGANQSIDDVVRDVGRDRWFDAQQARAYGFIDHIVTSTDEIVPQRPTRQIGLTRTARGHAA